jgi:3-phenylpropionate/cinnamic acid dioxygenase small subunit
VEVGEFVTARPADREVHDDVAEVLVRYATGIDTRDWTLFRTCFADDCQLDYGAHGVWNDPDAFTEYFEKVHAPYGHSLHRITNHAVRFNSEGVTARSYFDAIVMFADNKQVQARAAGYYDDDLTRTDQGWKIANRKVVLVDRSVVQQTDRTTDATAEG